jgi:hypothetical protein
MMPMSSDLHGTNLIEVDGAPMLLTTTGGGVAVHLTPAAQAPGTGREAVPDFLSLATSMGPGFCHDLGTTWLRGEHGRGGVGVST